MKSSFITTNLVGGLGNQMFLVANLLATARRTGLTAVLPRLMESSSAEFPRPVYWRSVFEGLKEFGVGDTIPHGHREIVIPERRPVGLVQVPSATATAATATTATLYNMIGFFQSDAFFKDWHTVMHELVPTRLVMSAREHMEANYISDKGAHTVGVHLRRGDYTRMQDIFEPLRHDYYSVSLEQLLGSALYQFPERLRVLVFCEEQVDGDLLVGFLRAKYRFLPVTLVHPKNEANKPLRCDESQPREVVELLMLSQCHDVIMANSSFSWWAAYLNTVPLHRIVAPSRWFVKDPYPQSNHLYCDGWVLL